MGEGKGAKRGEEGRGTLICLLVATNRCKTQVKYLTPWPPLRVQRGHDTFESCWDLPDPLAEGLRHENE